MSDFCSNKYFAGNRRTCREIHIGSVTVGGNAPIAVQSMTNTDTRNVAATLEQISSLTSAGCEIVRLAVLDERAVMSLHEICASSPIPIIADIHFDHRLALGALAAGVTGLRINPGNIGGESKVDHVVDAAKAYNASIRIGVNSGSIDKRLLDKYKGVTPQAMVESALEHVKILEKRGFYATKISLKASSVPLTVSAYRLLANVCDYPLHIGITEAGPLLGGAIKSAVGIGLLLAQGLGDTIRVSLTHDPVSEVETAWKILSALELRKRGPDIISCPTCGRTEIDLIPLAQAVEEKLKNIHKNFSVAVMGCVVNGPGEAKEADVGIAGGKGKAVLFRKGCVVRSITGDQHILLAALMDEINVFLKESDHENSAL